MWAQFTLASEVLYPINFKKLIGYILYFYATRVAPPRIPGKNSWLAGSPYTKGRSEELNLQLDAVKEAGCLQKNVFIDKASGSKTERPGLQECLRRIWVEYFDPEPCK